MPANEVPTIFGLAVFGLGCLYAIIRGLMVGPRLPAVVLLIGILLLLFVSFIADFYVRAEPSRFSYHEERMLIDILLRVAALLMPLIAGGYGMAISKAERQIS